MKYGVEAAAMRGGDTDKRAFAAVEGLNHNLKVGKGTLDNAGAEGTRRWTRKPSAWMAKLI